MKKYIFRIICIPLLPLAILVNYLSSQNPDLTEKYYTMGIYRVFSVLLSNFFDVFSFSVIEIFLYLLFVICLILLVKLFTQKKKKTKKINRSWYKGILIVLLNIAAAFCVIYFIFIFSWGLNYNRKTAFEIFGYEKQEVTLDKLIYIGTDLIDSLNVLIEDIKEPDLELKAAINKGNIGYHRLQDRYPELGGNYNDVKPVISSFIMSNFQIWGIYSPFTFESNINTMIPDVLIPSTIAHELSHKRGFAREDEANFLAYLTCSNHTDPAYIYSGKLSAFINIYNAASSTDQDAGKALYDKLDPRIKEHLNEINEFNKKYEGVLEQVSESATDVFLKSNRQTDGVRSYGRMVDLIVASYFVQ